MPPRLTFQRRRPLRRRLVRPPRSPPVDGSEQDVSVPVQDPATDTREHQIPTDSSSRQSAADSPVRRPRRIPPRRLVRDRNSSSHSSPSPSSRPILRLPRSRRKTSNQLVDHQSADQQSVDQRSADQRSVDQRSAETQVEKTGSPISSSQEAKADAEAEAGADAEAKEKADAEADAKASKSGAKAKDSMPVSKTNKRGRKSKAGAKQQLPAESSTPELVIKSQSQDAEQVSQLHDQIRKLRTDLENQEKQIEQLDKRRQRQMDRTAIKHQQEITQHQQEITSLKAKLEVASRDRLTLRARLMENNSQLLGLEQENAALRDVIERTSAECRELRQQNGMLEKERNELSQRINEIAMPPGVEDMRRMRAANQQLRADNRRLTADNEHLNKQLEATFERGFTECCICKNGIAQVIALPCRHVYACLRCAPLMKEHDHDCPICRAKIVESHELIFT